MNFLWDIYYASSLRLTSGAQTKRLSYYQRTPSWCLLKGDYLSTRSSQRRHNDIIIIIINIHTQELSRAHFCSTLVYKTLPEHIQHKTLSFNLVSIDMNNVQGHLFCNSIRKSRLRFHPFKNTFNILFCQEHYDHYCGMVWGVVVVVSP